MDKSYKKICLKCKSTNTKKDGKRKWRQSYRCNDCGHVWITTRRKINKINKDSLYKDFSLHKQTYKELVSRYGISIKTVQNYLDTYKPPEIKLNNPTEIVLLVDTTYFWNTGLMVFKSVNTKEILHYQIVNYETNEWYRQWIRHLQQQWRIIKAIVCDWRRWLLWWFEWIPTQMCQFHQMQIIRRYITKTPILNANKELKGITDWLIHTNKEILTEQLDDWYIKYEKFIKEKWRNAKGKPYYIHRRTRSAYYSLRKNMKYLFVYLEYQWKIDIPNTTNWLEGFFSHLKYRVNLHRWLREDRKLKLISFLLSYTK